MSAPVRVTRGTGSAVATIHLDRGEKLNAFDDALRDGLSRALAETMDDPEVAVVILRGEGRAFSVGMDVSPGRYLGNGAEASRLRLDDQVVTRALELWDAPKPIIAQVHGWCLGIATILCLCCDVTVVASDARIGWPKLPLGAGMIGPTWASAVGISRAKELSFQVGSELSGAEAARIGFANAAHAPDDLESEVMALASRIARTPGDLLRIKKAAINAVAERQGFRESLRAAASWDALSHTCESIDATRALIAEHGMKGAIATFMDTEEGTR